MYSKVELITPDKAKQYLECNIENNRKITKEIVNMYAADMASGAWQVTSQGITFNEDGKLTDGQHRLSAIIKAGVPVWMNVTYGESRNVTIHDRMRKRTLSNVMAMSGCSKGANSPKLIGATNLLLSMYCDRRISDSEKMRFIEENESDLLMAKALCQKSGDHSLMDKAPCIAAVFSALYCGETPESLECFCRVANSGFQEHKNESAAIVARNYAIVGIRKEGFGLSRPSRIRMYNFFTLAIKDFCSGVSRTRVYKKDAKPEYFDSVSKHLLSKYFFAAESQAK